MPVIIVGGEKNFAALRPRLLSGRVSPAAAREVITAVKAANPHADLDALQPGTILTVPDLPRISVAGAVSVDDQSLRSVAGLAEAAGATLDEVVRAGKARDRVAAAERGQVAKALDADELAVAVRQDKALAADLKAAREALGTADADAGERATALVEARALWTEELKALRAMLP